MKANAIPLSALGLSTVEAVPLFHYSPGGRALRILAFPSRWPSSECPLPFDVCDWIESPRSYQEYHVSIDVVASLASRWGVDVTVIDGVETWRFAELLSSIGRPLAARSQGLLDFNPESAGRVEVLIADFTGVPGSHLRLARTVRRAISKGLWVEANVYLEKPSMEKVKPALEAVSGTEAPLHIHIHEPQGGGPVSRLWEAVSNRHWPVYIHADVHSRVDTRCPSCGSFIATRHGGLLTSLSLREGGRCYSCGEPIPFKGKARSKTDPLFARLTRGRVQWLDPRSLTLTPGWSL